MSNPSLRTEPLDQQAGIVSSKQEPSILDWLEQSGRLIPREGQGPEILTEDEEVEEIAELMTGDDLDYVEEDEVDLEE